MFNQVSKEGVRKASGFNYLHLQAAPYKKYCLSLKTKLLLQTWSNYQIKATELCCYQRKLDPVGSTKASPLEIKAFTKSGNVAPAWG